MLIGTLKRPHVDRGYVFVRFEDGREVYLHASEFDGDFDLLRGGERVEVAEIVQNGRGPACVGVRLA
jgi:cold shock CspA family protein